MAKDVFSAIARQKRGGRKMLFAMITSPTCGMDRFHCCWWPTVRGIESAAVRLMESYVHSLGLDISAEASLEELQAITPPNANLTDADASVLLKKKILADVKKSITERLSNVDMLNSFVITTEGGRDEIEIVISLNIQDNDDSALGELPVEKKPTPTVAFLPPKSEAGRDSKKNQKPTDAEGFWFSNEDEISFDELAQMSPG